MTTITEEMTGSHNREVIGNMMDEITAVRDVGKGVKQKGGKVYTMVQDRVEVLRRNAGDYYRITTELLQWSQDPNGMIVVRATIRDFSGQVVSTGHAEEIRGANYINETSALENCETSAIGRALAVLGLHGGEFASADEIAVAVAKRERMSNNVTQKDVVNTLTVKDPISLKTEQSTKTAAKLEVVAPATQEKEKAAKAEKKDDAPVQLDLEDAVRAAGGATNPPVADHPLMSGVSPGVVELVEKISSSTPVLKRSKDAEMLEECFKAFIPLCETVDQCYSFWNVNEHIVHDLKQDHPEVYERVLAHFVEAKAKITKNNKGKKK